MDHYCLRSFSWCCPWHACRLLFVRLVSMMGYAALSGAPETPANREEKLISFILPELITNQLTVDVLVELGW